MGKDKRPAIQFYVKDWLSDPELRGCSSSAQGVWITMLCLMYNSEERGYLISGGKPWPDERIIQAIHCADSADCIKLALCELRENGVARTDERGATYNARMVRDHKLSLVRSESGAKGGNPRLLKQKRKIRLTNLVNQSVADADAEEECIPPEEGMQGEKLEATPALADAIQQKPARPADPIWDVICELFSLKPVTQTERKRVGSIVRTLKAKSATVEQIQVAFEYCRERFDPFGPEALVKWFDQAQKPITGKRPTDANASRVAAPPGKYDGVYQ